MSGGSKVGNIREKIPRKIHYCWFGGKEKPRIVEKCINSWKKHLPEFEIIEWNEKNSILIVIYILGKPMKRGNMHL